MITSWGSFGDVYPYVGLALTLLERGHRPVLAVPEFYRGLVEGVGLDFRPVGPMIDPNDHATIARVMDPVTGTAAIVEGLLVPSVRADYDALRAVVAEGIDLMVTHPVTFAAPVVAEAMGLPWVSTVLAPISFFSSTDPPVLAPAPRLARFQRLGPWAARLVSALAHRMSAAWMEPVQALRIAAGLRPGAHPLFEGQFSPFGTLALFSRVLGSPQPDWPPLVSIPGFVFYNGPESMEPALQEFLDAGEPPVVFTLGSSAVGAAGSFYEESARAVTRLGVRAVLLTGGFAQNQPKRELSPDILAVPRAPHSLLFPRARAVVHQVGIGTSGQALRAGRPMLAVPFGHDQPDNAFRVNNLGVARVLSPRKYEAKRVARELDALLGDGSYQQRAAEVAAVVSAEGGVAQAADALEQVLRSSR